MKEQLTNKNWNELRDLSIDLGIAILLAIIAIVSFCFSIITTELDAYWRWISFAAAFVIGVLLAGLYLFKWRIVAKRAVTKTELLKEKKINAINSAIFDSLNQLNMSKVRETLRFTYGSVSEWNPMSYSNNVLTYDVHEQIRAILISIKQVVIGIDPSRFNDHNVTVDLIFGYPEKNEEIKKEKNEEIKKWKLISSGDISGNPRKATPHTEEAESFYSFLGYCGMRFVNEKFAFVTLPEGEASDSYWEYYCRPLREKKKCLLEKQANAGECQPPKESEKIESEIIEIDKRITEIENNKKIKVYKTDAKDIEHFYPQKTWAGSIAGAVIKIKNDAPEELFVEAILTINTYGEPIHKPEKKNGKLDKDGMTVENYETLFCDNIMGTYTNLLASELSQMYIRHAIRRDIICPNTGRNLEKEMSKHSLRIADCASCTDRSKCKAWLIKN